MSGEVKMAVALMFQNPNVTREQYDATRAKLDVDHPDRMPDGAILHLAGPHPDGGWRVFEVWESEAAARRFITERLEPLFAASGRELAEPEVWQLHACVHR
jgi:hypothetical protein